MHRKSALAGHLTRRRTVSSAWTQSTSQGRKSKNKHIHPCPSHQRHVNNPDGKSSFPFAAACVLAADLTHQSALHHLESDNKPSKQSDENLGTMSLDNLDNRNTSQPAEPPRPCAYYLALYTIYRTLGAVGQEARCRVPSGRCSTVAVVVMIILQHVLATHFAVHDFTDQTRWAHIGRAEIHRRVACTLPCPVLIV